MRQYQQIWEALKKSDKIQITFPRSSHKRIVKAVRKESHKDLGFRLLTLEDNRKFRITTASLGDNLYITLRWSEINAKSK